MTTMKSPHTGTEKEILLHSMERHRAAVRWKLEGLDDEQLRRQLVPSGTSLLGLVKHLAAVEYGWFCMTFGVKTESLPFDDDDEDADLRIEPGETTADLLAFYDRACAAANAVIEATDLDATGTSWSGAPVSMRWVLVTPATELLINYFWLHWIYLGAVFGLLAMLAVTRWLVVLGVPSPAFCWVVWAILGQASGAYVGPACWAILYLAGAAAILHQRPAPVPSRVRATRTINLPTRLDRLTVRYADRA